MRNMHCLFAICKITSMILYHDFICSAAHFRIWCALLICTSSPGGDRCINLNLSDFQSSAGKEHQHWLKYQGAVLPNRIAMV